MQRDRGKGEGVRVVSPPFFWVSWPGSGQGRWGVDRGESRRELGHCGKDRSSSYDSPPLLVNIGFDYVRFLPRRCLMKCLPETFEFQFKFCKIG
jgi:hypothetical protein